MKPITLTAEERKRAIIINSFAQMSYTINRAVRETQEKYPKLFGKQAG